MNLRRDFGLSVVLALSLMGLSSCATSVPARPAEIWAEGPLAFGRTQAVLSAPSTRWYAPEVRFLELRNRATHERIRVDVVSADGLFVLNLPPGEYELTRVQINEGPFLAMADLTATFRVNPDGVTYLGTWRFMLDSPRTQRMVIVAAVLEQAEAQRQLTARYPDLAGRPLVTVLPDPATAETRLYEVSPYPRYRYFRRQP